ncbi:hypothetical protein G3I59_36880 [Amycolatopsis rubida]|uniref:Aminoglycoside phosphotransferase domain-containing protein n=1 Tax=Amycolatopsis rubida TaxID=112413 RepID=A0ABX0BZX1_9PSEU|nr:MULTISPECIES: phosphotransferase [Amycolatopsis]MYW96035.1 hypothetical protein [Amycolatopsis rubida]NEC61026.1 hypothetical protein [Amycolatopsis rubida]OAP20534.1 Phosphotransferase enzyme family protein [Amycolatopsis sp. M39]
MERFSWDALPTAVHSEVLQNLGPVEVVRDVEQGQNSSLAVVLRTDLGPVFLKGVRGRSPQMRWLRNEAEAVDLAPGLAPAKRFSTNVVDTDADELWFIVGFEYVNGRPADLTPDSDDLPVVGSTVANLSAFSGGPLQPLAKRWALADWWTKFADERPDEVRGWDLVEMTEWSGSAADLVDGSSLLHTDLHEHQFMIDDASSTVRVVDWGRPASGAAWVDTAFLVIRLVAAGHTPEAAEEWAATVPAWRARTDKGVTAFASYVAGLWSYRAASTPFPGATRLSVAAREYARYRLSM